MYVDLRSRAGVSTACRTYMHNKTQVTRTTHTTRTTTQTNTQANHSTALEGGATTVRLNTHDKNNPTNKHTPG